MQEEYLESEADTPLEPPANRGDSKLSLSKTQPLGGHMAQNYNTINTSSVPQGQA